MEEKHRKAGFERLRIWHEAHQLMLTVQRHANQLPHPEHSLRIQAHRSSSGVCDNIAEAQGSFYYNDKLKGLYTARKEIAETQNHLKSFSAKGYLGETKADELIHRYQGLIIGINKMARYISTKRDRHNRTPQSS